MTPQEAYKKALDALGDVQFVDNTIAEAMRAKSEVEQILAGLLADLLPDKRDNYFPTMFDFPVVVSSAIPDNVIAMNTGDKVTVIKLAEESKHPYDD